MASDQTIHSYVLDNGLGVFSTLASSNVLYIGLVKTGIIGTSFNPNDSGSYSSVTNINNLYGSYQMATSDIASPSFITGTYGREVVFSQMQGAVSTAGNVTHYAVYETSGSRVLITGKLQSTTNMSANGVFSTQSFSVGLIAPD